MFVIYWSVIGTKKFNERCLNTIFLLEKNPQLFVRVRGWIA